MSIEIGGRPVTVAATARAGDGRQTLVGAKRMLAITPEQMQELQAERKELRKLKQDTLLGDVLQQCAAIKELFRSSNKSAAEKVDGYLQKRRDVLSVVDDWVKARVLEGGDDDGSSDEEGLKDDKKNVESFDDRFGTILQQFSGSTKNKNVVEKILRAMNGDANIKFDRESYDVIINGERLGVNLTDMLQDLIRPTNFSRRSGEVSKAMLTFLKELAHNSTLGVRSIPNQQLQQKFKQFRDNNSSGDVPVSVGKKDVKQVVNDVMRKKVRLYYDPKVLL